MTRTIRHTLAAAALLAAAGFALPARADHDDWSRHGALPPPAFQASAPGVVPAPAVVVTPPYAARSVYVAPYRLARWREAPALRDLRAEYHRLDLARDRFYATWDGRPWTRDRFESWYAARRAELDHRWAELWGSGERRW